MREKNVEICQYPHDLNLACETEKSVGGLMVGTRILTPEGSHPVENLSVGDSVMTANGKSKKIREIVQTRLRATGDQAPIRFLRGVFGNSRDVWVSPNYKVLSSLDTAETLIDHELVTVEYSGFVTYVQLTLSQPNFIFAEDMPVFAPGLETAEVSRPNHIDDRIAATQAQ